MIPTLGEIELRICGTEVKFQVVDNNFAIDESGILGTSFLVKQEATLEFRQNLPGRVIFGDKGVNFAKQPSYDLPPRMKKLIRVPVKNKDREVGYIRRIIAGPGVFMGEVLGRQKEGFVLIYAINTTNNHINLTLPPVKIEECEIHPPLERSNNAPELDETQAAADRLAKLSHFLKLDGLSEAEKVSILQTVVDYPYQFLLPGDKLGSTTVIQHTINTADEQPINTKQYRGPPTHKAGMRDQVGDLLHNGIIQESNSPSNSPVWVVPKKPDPSGKPRWRMVIDYRNLNEKTIGDAYPLPNITDILDQLGGAKYFSTLDLASGFQRIPLHPDSKRNTAFSNHHGHYEFNRMPFGLKNAPSTFQRAMDRILSGLQDIEMFVYMDNMVIYANSLEEHARKLGNVLGRLKSAGLALQPEKCSFLQKRICYLGHIISSDGVRPDPRKIEAVK